MNQRPRKDEKDEHETFLDRWIRTRSVACRLPGLRRSNAYVLFKERLIGSLEVGKLADLVVLDRDYMSIPADDIVNIAPLLTMVGGRTVFDGNEEKAARR